jgi:hypothetical protein
MPPPKKICVELPDCAFLPGFERYWLRPEEDPENLAENHFFYHQRDCHRKDQSRDHGHECDELLHMSSPVWLNGVAIG